MTGLFFQSYWSVVGHHVCDEVRKFFDSGSFPVEWNFTQLCLLPKKPNPNRMTDLRPISLCSVSYKIISKILCSRLKVWLPKIVSDAQGAFVSGRLISGNVLLAHEMVHALYALIRTAMKILWLSKLICLRRMIELNGIFWRSFLFDLVLLDDLSIG